MSLNNLPRKARKSCSNKSWIELLRPIIQDFKEGSNEALSPQEVERLSLIIRFKIDLDEEIDLVDEDELLDQARISLDIYPKKSGSETCPPKGCANCTCGRDTRNEEISSEVVSGCGNCYLGDGFRCGNCLYKGTPPFEPGQIIKDNYISESYIKLMDAL